MILLLAGVCGTATRAAATDMKLWPLFDYHSDNAGNRSLHLLGPLFAFETSRETVSLTLRPLVSLTRGPRENHRQFTLLYPLFVSRWDRERTALRFLGLVSYHTEPAHHADESDRRFTVFPFVFYRHSPSRGSSLAVLPFYADIYDFFGYERVQMVAFPLYLRLRQPLIQHTWLPFPFVSWAGGSLGHGVRVLPFYGWEQDGETNRFTYVMWPFYIVQERHVTRPEHERRVVVFPFYSTIDSPTQHSRGVGVLTHTVDLTKQTDTWGFPWPLWLSQRDRRTGERTGLRLAPFYEDTHFGKLHSQFMLWPAYRWSTQEVDDYRHTRRDALLLLYRDIEDVQLARHHWRHLQSVFPLYRWYARDGESEWSTLAVLDALFPRNPTIQQLYAPLWQLYARRQAGEQPARWSLLWDLVSSDGTRISYPVDLDLSK